MVLQILAVNAAATAAFEETNAATDAVTATKDKLAVIVSDILNIQQLDPARIEQLRQEVFYQT